MNAQLLLLLALAGPFCAFTRASPTIIPTGNDSFFITGPPPTVPEVVPREMTTAAATTEVFLEITATPATAEVPLNITTAAASEVPPEVTMEAMTEAALNDTVVASKSTEVPEQQQPLSTHAAAVETAAPTKVAEVVQTSGTAAATTKSSGDVVIQEDAVDGLTSGQAAGIVIGALLAVATVITVAIVVARRMGKYTP